MKNFIGRGWSLTAAPTLAMHLICCTYVIAQEEQTPININRSTTIKESSPPSLKFNNYTIADLKVENTYGGKERFFTVAGNPGTPGELKNITVAKEWATLKATPCRDSTLTSCASYANRLSNGPSITVEGKEYVLQQFHFHAPAEHTVDGKRPAMEVHFVHLLNNGCAADDHRPGAVVGAFIDEGIPDAELGKFFDAFNAQATNNPEGGAQFVRANLGTVLPAVSFTWRYEGGLTAPSGSGLCGVTIPESIPGGGTVAQQLISGVFPEVVHWYLYEKPLHLSSDQIRRFMALFPEGNSRALKENSSKVYESAVVPSAPAVATKAVANPKNTTALSSISLDGKSSVSFDGKPLTYSWKVATGGKTASISKGDTSTPLVQFQEGYGNYGFELTVTDSAGKTDKDTTTVLYVGR